MVLIKGAGNTTVEFLSTPISTRLRRLRGWSARGWAIIVSNPPPKAAAARYCPSALMTLARFALRIRLTSHSTLHGAGMLVVLQLEQRHLGAPVEDAAVEDLAHVEVDPVRLGEDLVAGVLPDDLAQGRLGDLVGRGIHILDSR